jgi:glycosyltransferase involved in cell wall biosynthesis
VSDLLQAFSQLHEKLELWFVGTGPLSSIIRQYSTKHGVRAIGHVDWKDMPRIYQACDIFCLPSKDSRRMHMKIWEEQLGFALVEAMATGLPIVSTNCGAIPEIVGQDNPIVAQGDIQGLANAIGFLANDNKSRSRIGSNNRMRAERLFDATNQCQKYLDLIGSLS